MFIPQLPYGFRNRARAPSVRPHSGCIALMHGFCPRGTLPVNQPVSSFFLSSFPRGRAKTKGSICEYPLKCSRFCSSVFSRAASRTRRRTTSIPPSIISPHRITLKRISTAWCGAPTGLWALPTFSAANPLPDLTVPASYDGRTNLWESTFPVRRGNSPSWDTASWMSAKCAQATSSPSGAAAEDIIYIGDGRFIHAPRTNSRVRVESCDSAFFRNNFIGARRIIMTGSNRAMTEVAELEDMDRPSRQSVRRGHGRSVKHSASRTRSSKASRSHRRSKRR